MPIQYRKGFTQIELFLQERNINTKKTIFGDFQEHFELGGHIS